MCFLVHFMIAFNVHRKVGSIVIWYAILIPVRIQHSFGAAVIETTYRIGDRTTGAVSTVYREAEAMVNLEITSKNEIMGLVIISRVKVPIINQVTQGFIGCF